MKTPDKIKDALLRCSNAVCFGDEEICAYRSEGSAYCMMALTKDALAYIEQLESEIAAKNDMDNRMEDDLK